MSFWSKWFKKNHPEPLDLNKDIVEAKARNSAAAEQLCSALVDGDPLIVMFRRVAKEVSK